jgi:hypothetical protein
MPKAPVLSCPARYPNQALLCFTGASSLQGLRAALVGVQHCLPATTVTIAPLLFGSLPSRSSHGTAASWDRELKRCLLRRRSTGRVWRARDPRSLAASHKIDATRIDIWIFFRQVELGTTTLRGPKDLNPKFGVGARLRSFGGDRNPRLRCLGTRGFSSVIVSYGAGDRRFLLCLLFRPVPAHLPDDSLTIRPLPGCFRGPVSCPHGLNQNFTVTITFDATAFPPRVAGVNSYCFNASTAAAFSWVGPDTTFTSPT